MTDPYYIENDERVSISAPALDCVGRMDLVESGGLPPDATAALTIWGEARSEGHDGMLAVASVIYRRAMRHSAITEQGFPLAVADVCLAKHQFSCWNAETGKFTQHEPYKCLEWDECWLIAADLMSMDFTPTIVATHYFSDSMPDMPYWAKKMEFVKKIGHHLFYKEW